MSDEARRVSAEGRPTRIEPAAITPAEAGATDRRVFLGQLSATATIAWLWIEGLPDPASRAPVVPTAPDAEPRSLSKSEWRTLDAALDAILPSAEGEPGATSVHAIGYLDGALADSDMSVDSIERVQRAAATLDADARAAGAPHYAALDAAGRSAGLAKLADGPWERQYLLRQLLGFAFEALLGDPRHGGNPGGIGWAWAEHTPGYPRPPEGWRPSGEPEVPEGDR